MLSVLLGVALLQRGVAQPSFSLFAEDVLAAAKSSRHTVAETVSKLKAVGITGIDADYSQAQKDELLAAGMKPASFYGFVKFLSEDGGRKQSDEFLSVAVRHGAKRIMIVPDNFTDGGDREAEYAKMAAGLKSLAAAAKAKGIIPLIEDFGNPKNPCSEMKYLRRFLRDVPDLQFALDSGNLHYADKGEDIVAFAREIGAKRIGHVHLKDFKVPHSREYVSVGAGAVPNEDIVRFVDASGYDGWYTLENPVGDNLLADAIRQHETVMRWCRAHRSPDYEPGTYWNARERAANSLKYAWVPNRFLEKVVAGKRALGGYLELGDPVVAEAAGLSGLDFVWIDAEHHPYSVRDLMLVDIALKGTGCASLVRVRSHEADYLKQLLDIGIDGVIVPMVNSVEEAKAVIAACRYPQEGGRRGVCVSRQSGYGRISLKDYFKRSETAPFICLEFEHVDALRDIDEMLALDGYDAVMVGTSDLSCSLNSIGLASSDGVREKVREIARKTRAAGKLFYALSEGWVEQLDGQADLVDGAADLGSFTEAIHAFLDRQSAKETR